MTLDSTVSESRVAKTPRQLRDEVEQLIRDDLIGPLGGAEEELHDPPVDRYLLGLLAPRFGFGRPAPASPAAGSGDDEDEEDPIAADAQPEDALAAAGPRTRARRARRRIGRRRSISSCRRRSG